jgi:hypothetical protein
MNRRNDAKPAAKQDPLGTAGTHDAKETEARLQLCTAEQAAALLQVSPWWLRKQATARHVPCTFVGR